MSQPVTRDQVVRQAPPLSTQQRNHKLTIVAPVGEWSEPIELTNKRFEVYYSGNVVVLVDSVREIRMAQARISILAPYIRHPSSAGK